MDAGGKEYSIELDRQEVIEGVRDQYDAIQQLVDALIGKDEDVTLFVAHHLCRLPGLVDRLEGYGRVVELAPTAAAAGALEAKDRILAEKGSEELTFVTRLPLVVPEEGAPSVQGSTADVPTHVLQDGVAQSITTEPFFVGESECVIQQRAGHVVVENKCDAGTWVNDKKIEGPTRLCAGDRVRVGETGGKVELIRVKD
jgi:hypothetical protein